MKRFIMLIIILLTLCSCASESTEISLDCDNNFQQFNALKITGDGETLFFVPDISQSLWYYDKNAEISGILCGKPECSHTGSDCNAFFDGVTLGFYGGRLYGLSAPYSSECKIFSSSPDGSGRKTELDLSGSEFSKMLNGSVENLRGLFHRGFFYACGTHNTVTDGIMQSRAQVFAYSLDSGKGGLIYENSELTDIEIFPQGDFLYFYLYGESSLKIYRYSPSDGANEELFSGDTDIESPKIWIKNDEIYIGDKGDSREIFILNLTEKSLEKIFSFDPPYLFCGFTDDFAVGGYMDGIDFRLCLKDFSGNDILQTSFAPPGISGNEPLFTFPCGVDGETVYLWSKVWSAEHDVQFLNEISVKSGKSSVIWTNDQPQK